MDAKNDYSIIVWSNLFISCNKLRPRKLKIPLQSCDLINKKVKINVNIKNKQCNVCRLFNCMAEHPTFLLFKIHI